MQEFVPEKSVSIRRGWPTGSGQNLRREARTNRPVYPSFLRRVEPTTVPEVDDERPITSTEMCRFGKAREFALRVAACEKDRLKCWHLVYKEYLALGYTDRKELEYRYSLHDALPDMGTFLVESQGQAVGTVSVFPDSPLGLPADDHYKTEVDKLRWQGRRPVEVGRLTIDREHMNERSVLTSMFDILSLYARRIRKATDLVITVNPSHAKFYERVLLFERIGQEKRLDGVGGAPAVLLRLDLELQRKVIRWEHGEGSKPDGKVERTFYKYFSSKAEEELKVARMRACLSIPEEAFLKRYFVWLRPLLPQHSGPLKDFFAACYPQYDLVGA